MPHWHRNLVVVSWTAMLVLFVAANGVAAQVMDDQDYKCSPIGVQAPFEIRAVQADCRAFVICANGRPVRLVCPAGLMFNSALGVSAKALWKIQINLNFLARYLFYLI